MKKILYVGYEKEPNIYNSISFSYKAWYESFKALNYEVKGLFTDSKNFQKDYNKYFDDALNGFKPEMVFIIINKNYLSIDFLNLFKYRNIKLVGFSGDDNWNFSSFRDLFQHFDSIVTTDNLSIRKYNRLGIKNVVLSQWGTFIKNDHIDVEKYEFEISFVGGYSAYREWFINQIRKKTGITVNKFGYGWKGRPPISYDEMKKIFSSSKINLNISNSYSYDYRFRTSSAKNFFKTFLNKHKQSEQIKARNFEIPACGGFQLTNYVPFLEGYFEIGEEIVCYDGVDNAINLIEYYLHNEDIREKIRQKSHKKSIKNYTFNSILENIIKQLSLDGS